ncbi:MAG TPA: hypothetical protein DDY38_00420, partial [Firmicutes bacterium]|nr:hypothetical protein [Bacillota bacterium]
VLAGQTDCRRLQAPEPFCLFREKISCPPWNLIHGDYLLMNNKKPGPPVRDGFTRGATLVAAKSGPSDGR